MTIKVAKEPDKIFRYDPKEVIKAYIGVNGKDIDQPYNLEHKEHSVDAVIKHDGWDGSGATFPDIAIIKLARKVKFNLKPEDFEDSILPACLPTPKIRKQLYNTKAFVAGNTRYVH